MHHFMLANARPKHVEQLQSTKRSNKENKVMRMESYQPYYLKSVLTHSLLMSIEFQHYQPKQKLYCLKYCMPSLLNHCLKSAESNSDLADPTVLDLALKNTMSNATMSEAALAITKLKGCENWIQWSANIKLVLDHTWEFVKGGKSSPPQEDSPEFNDWSNGNHAACQRIWLALSDKVQDTIFHHFKSPAAMLFKVLKNQYEQSGASAEFYTTKTYNDTKLCNYDSITDFLNVL